MRIKIEGNIDDDSRDLRVLLEKMAEIHAAERHRKWRMDCRGCRYLGPWATSLISAAYLQGQELKQSPRVQLPEEPPALKAFCLFSGMSQLFAKGPPPNPDHPECETIPLERFSTASWDRSNRIIRLLRRHTELGTEREDQIQTCVQEVTQNIVDHSSSTIGGVMSARYLRSFAEVRVGVVDRGVGIAARLNERWPDTTNSRVALQRVIRGGYTSRSRPNNMGLGVSNLFALVETAGGRMALFTGDAFAEVRPGLPTPSVEDLDYDFPGTAVFFSLPITP